MRNIGRKTAMNIEKKLYQWDTEQKLTGCTGLYVDFPIGNEVYRVETIDGTCIIPDELLQTSGSHKVYECMTNNTIRSFAFSVTPRPKPPDYVYTPTERLTFEGLVQRVDDAVADMIRRAESGEFDGHTPVKGTDYFTTGEIQQIQNEVSSGAIGEFKSVVDTETETFNTNAESKLTTYNENDVAKTGAYNTNASDKLDDYNTNASNKVTEYNSNAENKTAEFDTHTEQIQADISELKSDLYKLDDTVLDLALNVKLINAPLDISGYVQTSGFINTNEDARNTGYVRVNANCKVAYRTIISNISYELAFFDKDKNLLSDISIVGGNGEVERIIDLSLSQYSEVKYCIVSVYGSSYFENAYCHIYADNNILDRLETVITDDEITSYIPDNGNHFNKDTVIVGKEVYGNGSLAKESNSAISDFIPVYGKKQIFINNLPVYEGYDRFCYFYDENKEPISQATNISAKSSRYSYKIPNNAKYFVFSVYQRWTGGSKDYGNIMVTFNDYEEYKPYQLYADSIGGYKVSPITKLGTSNKKMIIFGDSITETASISDDGTSYTEGTRTNWMTFAKSYLDTTNFKNYAKSGATYKDTNGGTYRQNVSEQITMAMADSNNDDAEIIVMALGTNDGGASIGDYDTAMAKTSLDDLDRTNLYEALRWAMWTLRNKYTNATCFVGMPIQRASGEQPTAMIEAIKKMANRYNFVIIDATNESGIIREFETSGASGRYLADGLHPNTDGSIKIAKLYSNVILRNFMIN